ncbi:glycoside hydrolase superfamily [Paraphoma chrysanthemicola]|nr:glycoside hydrolase superfamily [Paraphoma chrysanthemicola]
MEQRMEALTIQVDKLSRMMGAGEWYPPKQPGESDPSTPTNGYTGTVGHPHVPDSSYFALCSTKPTDSPPSYPTTTKYTAPTTIPKPPVGDRDGYRAVGYYGNWDIYARNFTPQQIPASRLTHLLYSFADNRPDGTVFLTDTFADVEKHWATDSWSESGNNMYGNLKQLGLLKQKNRNLKVMLSIGGWTYTNEKKHMDPVGASTTAIQTFARSCVDMVRNYGFDGIDIDWEYPQDATQGLQFLAMLRETRKALDGYADQLGRDKGYAAEARPRFLLSIAAPAGEANYKNMPLKEVSEEVDFVNLMAYDYAGSWDKTTGHGSNLAPSRSNPKSTPYNTDSVVQHYLRSGVPSQKLNLGMPLYGHAFTNTAGLGQPYNGNGKGSFEAGIYDFKDLPLEGATEYWDEEAYATYSYDNSTNMLVSYDTVEMALTKVGYIKQTKLGGAMWWEVSGDKLGKGSIITNVVNDMSGDDGKGIESKPNWIYWPDSAYDNVKRGFAA